jgi:phosphoglucosamine mutase
VRPSGTEPLVRVMVEADTEELLQRKVDEIILLLQDEAKKSA